MATIRLKGLKFYAYHGVYEQERIKGNTFLVDLKITTNTSNAELHDNLADTIDYVTLAEIIKVEMEKPSKLLENVAYRINQEIKKKLHKGKIKTTVYKLNPPIGIEVAYTAVTVKTTI